MPVNQNFLTLSRLNFGLKKSKIQNVIIQKKREQKERAKMIKKKHQEDLKAFKQKDTDMTKDDNERIQNEFPRIFKEKIG